MDRTQTMEFELYVMDLAENCKTAEDYRDLAIELHESVENAIMDLCMDNGIEDYEPAY